MPNFTNDDIEAFASGAAKQGSGINLRSLDLDKDNLNAAEYITPAVLSTTEKSFADPDLCHNPERSTKQLKTYYHNFLSDMGSRRVEEMFTVNSNDDDGDRPRPQPSSGGHDEEKNRIATKDEGTIHRPWARCGLEEGIGHKLAPVNLAAIPEDSSLSSGVWPHHPSFGCEYQNDRKKALRKRLSFCQTHIGKVVTSVCAVASLVAMLPSTGKNKQSADDGVSTQQHDLYNAIADGDNPSDIYDRPPNLEEDDLSNFPSELAYKSKQNLIESSLQPLWFGVSNGWRGRSYEDGTVFCKSMSRSRFVCPYEAYCPGGPGMPPFRGIQGNEADVWWSPVWDDQPLLVGVGSMNTCLQTGILNDWNKNRMNYILCCDEKRVGIGKKGDKGNISIGSATSKPSSTAKVAASSSANNLSSSSQNTPDLQSSAPMELTEKEKATLDNMRPVWFGRKDGYQGTTHQEAVEFCNSVDDMQLCLPEAYCPNGSAADKEINPRPLFLRMHAFPGEQWAALPLNPNSWILVGTINGDPALTCETYDALHDNAQPLWGFDGTSTELKQHVLCCKDKPGNYGIVSEVENEEEGPATTSNVDGNGNKRDELPHMVIGIHQP